MRHLLDISDLDISKVFGLFEEADSYRRGLLQSLPLKGKTIINLFFENSTRTRSSFEMAAVKLGASVVNFDVSTSSTSKGESILDTASTINAMMPDLVVVRHHKAGMPRILSKYLKCSIVNGGDGSYAHPSQALLDAFTMRDYYNDFKGLRVGIMGDIRNSRVANSNLKLLGMLGSKCTLIAPPHFMKNTTLPCVHDLNEVIDDLDVLMVLRTQVERHHQKLYASLEDYAINYCVTKEVLGDRSLIVLHPGPVNRNVDLSDKVLEDERCKVLNQVQNGLFVRMAILNQLTGASC